jgi:uncharacterized radical SAM superfamily protein
MSEVEIEFVVITVLVPMFGTRNKEAFVAEKETVCVTSALSK